MTRTTVPAAPAQPETAASWRTSWKPTRKWLAAFVTAVTTVLVSGIESGFDATEEKMAVSLLLPLIASYILGNQSTPTGDGVPR